MLSIYILHFIFHLVLNNVFLNSLQVTEKLSTQIGPKTFTLDRLLAIFFAILEEKIGLTCNLLAQVC